jgi:hypothetical protein
MVLRRNVDDRRAFLERDMEGIGAIPRLDDASGCELLPRQVEFDEVHAVVPFWARAV